jgi:hypothetical protein
MTSENESASARIGTFDPPQVPGDEQGKMTLEQPVEEEVQVAAVAADGTARRTGRAVAPAPRPPRGRGRTAAPIRSRPATGWLPGAGAAPEDPNPGGQRGGRPVPTPAWGQRLRRRRRRVPRQPPRPRPPHGSPRQAGSTTGRLRADYGPTTRKPGRASRLVPSSPVPSWGSRGQSVLVRPVTVGSVTPGVTPRRPVRSSILGPSARGARVRGAPPAGDARPARRSASRLRHAAATRLPATASSAEWT